MKTDGTKRKLRSRRFQWYFPFRQTFTFCGGYWGSKKKKGFQLHWISSFVHAFLVEAGSFPLFLANWGYDNHTYPESWRILEYRDGVRFKKMWMWWSQEFFQCVAQLGTQFHTPCHKLLIHYHLRQGVWNCAPSCATYWQNSCDHHIHILKNLTPSPYSKICQLSGYVWLSYTHFAINYGKLPVSTKNDWKNDEI